MNGILKIKNIDSLKKLNSKRAKGKMKHLTTMCDSIDKTIKTMESLQLLTEDLLWELIQKRIYFVKERQKLDYVVMCRKYSIDITEEDCQVYLNQSSSLKIPLLNVPYELRNKYSKYVYEQSKKYEEF